MVTLAQLIDHLDSQGMPATVEGDASTQITAINTLDDATASELSFLANVKYEKTLATTQAGAVIVNMNVAPPKPMTLIRTEDPYAAISVCIELIHGYRKHPQWSVHPTAAIAQTARIGENPNIGPHVTIDEEVVVGDHVVIYPGCYVGCGSRLGNEVILYPNVVIYEGTIMGHRVAIHAGTIVGEDGLGYAPVAEHWRKIPHAGHVIIEDDVEIGANCTIDRATLGTTVIGRGSKFSNLIAIGHGTKIGENAMFVAQVGIAGSVTVGKHVLMGGQVGVMGHVNIGDNTRIGAKAGVVGDVEAGEFVLGQPAIKASEAKRVISVTQKLPELKQRIKALESELAELRAAVMVGKSSVVD